MIPFKIVCSNCGKETDSRQWQWQHECGGPLDIVLDLQGRRFGQLIDVNEQSMRRYAQLLAVEQLPSAHQGWTPIAKEIIDGVEVNFKLEYLCLGGSFKERGAYVSVVKAKELGLNGIVVDSSGNAGIGFSLMGLLCGIDVSVFISKDAPVGKKHLLKLLQAKIQEVDGSRMDANREAIKAAEREGLPYMTQWWNPYFIEGEKTMAYEAYEQIGSVDHVVAPVGSGTILLGLYKGYKELVELQALDKMPKFIGVQASGYSNICDQLGATKKGMAEAKLADGITEIDPPRRRQIVDAIRSTNGHAIIANDNEIKDSLVKLRKLGFIVEPTSAVSYVALIDSIKDGFIKPGDKVLLPLTGSGLKLIDELIEIGD